MLLDQAIPFLHHIDDNELKSQNYDLLSEKLQQLYDYAKAIYKNGQGNELTTLQECISNRLKKLRENINPKPEDIKKYLLFRTYTYPILAMHCDYFRRFVRGDTLTKTIEYEILSHAYYRSWANDLAPQFRTPH
jgi:hypothetical protein